MRSEWEGEAENWVRWARTPGHDAYWYYRDSFFDLLVPPPRGWTLEIGCGEGRVSRDLLGRGHRVVAVDSSPTLIGYARGADIESGYLLADAARLPFPDGSFDLAVAYNSLMDVADMPASVREATRVLRPGGLLCACVTHPLSDAGHFVGTDADAVFTINESYLGRRRVDDLFERDGLQMTFRGWCYPLEAYAIALQEAGLLIQAIREPEPAAETEGWERWKRLPMFLHFRAVKPG